MPEQLMDGQRKDGVTRRELLRRAAIVGGSVLWIAPAIQTLAPPAYADISTQCTQMGANCSTCCQCSKVGTTGGGPASLCFANNSSANTVSKCMTRCASQHPAGSNYTMQDFHEDFPAGSGKTFTCVNGQCSPNPH